MIREQHVTEPSERSSFRYFSTVQTESYMIHNTTATALFGRTVRNIVRGNTLSAMLFILFFSGIGLVSHTSAQVVTNPISELSTTIKHYSYTDMLTPVQKKELEYIIVKSSKGDIKTVFNACDVCYTAHKGYSQSGASLRCNNCGKFFLIDTLGNQPPPGTCSPGYLPHTIQGDQVVINVSDLKKGEYFFLPQTVSAVDHPGANPAGMFLANRNGQLTIQLPNEAHRTFHVVTINGQISRTLSSSSSIVQINTSGLSSGAYLLAVEEAGKMASQLFLVY